MRLAAVSTRLTSYVQQTWRLLKTHLWEISVLFSHALVELELTIVFYSVRITGVSFDNPSETSANYLPFRHKHHF